MGKKADRLIGLAMEPFKAAEIESDTIFSADTLSVAGNVTAAGSTLGTATALTALFNRVGTAALSTGVNLPNVDIGVVVTVRNDGANAVLVYPVNASGVINALSAGAGFSVASGSQARLIRTAINQWYSGA